MSTTSSELVKRQAEDKEKSQDKKLSNMPYANLQSDELNKPIGENDSSYIPTIEANKEPLDLAVQPVTNRSKNGSVADSMISEKTVSNENGSTQNPSGENDFSRKLQTVEQHENAKSPENIPRESIITSAKKSNNKDKKKRQDKSEINIEIDTIEPKTNGSATVVRAMLGTIDLKNSTDKYEAQFYHKFILLPQVEEDNLKWTKFSRAVAEAFVLDFSRMYEGSSNSSQDLPNNDDDDWEEDYHLDYNETYNLAVSHLKEKKGQTALQFAVPVMRTSDIFKAVLDVPIGVVKSKCKAYMTTWQCHAEYLAKLTDESEVCDHIWYHAELHLKILKTLEETKSIEDPTDIIIEKLESKIKSVKTKNSNSLLNFIIKTLRKLRSQLKKPLISHAQIFNYIKDSQSKGLLRCMNIDIALN